MLISSASTPIFRFDRTLGGLQMELRFRDHLAKLFNQQHPSKDVRQNPRAMAKLLKEANRVKTVLSANADHMAQVSYLPRNTVEDSLLSLQEACGKGQLNRPCPSVILLRSVV